MAKKYAKQEMIFGIEQEYTMLKADGTPLGFPDGGGFPGPQGPYYCGVGTGRVIGREIVEEHTQACIDAGLMIEGTNAEVMPGQWEFQIGAADALDRQRPPLRRPLAAAPHRRGLRRDHQLRRQAGEGRLERRRRAHQLLDQGDARGATQPIEAACKAIGKQRRRRTSRATAHDIESRLTGAHETAPYNKFSYGVSNRGASIRIPWQVAKDGKGYAEDRRPNANCDPYTVTRLILESVCAG